MLMLMLLPLSLFVFVFALAAFHHTIAKHFNFTAQGPQSPVIPLAYGL
jgi:hypothetical protein